MFVGASGSLVRLSGRVLIAETDARADVHYSE